LQPYIADTILDANWLEGVDMDKDAISSGALNQMVPNRCEIFGRRYQLSLRVNS
jgi:hypothetical protein